MMQEYVQQQPNSTNKGETVMGHARVRVTNEDVTPAD